jgi:hypothetical protein
MLLVFHNVQQRGHEYDGCYVRRPHGSVLSDATKVLSDPAGVLFGLEGEFRVLFV